MFVCSDLASAAEILKFANSPTRQFAGAMAERAASVRFVPLGMRFGKFPEICGNLQIAFRCPSWLLDDGSGNRDYRLMSQLEEMKRMHAKLEEAHRLARSLSPLRVAISADTAMAIGESVGILSRARALMGRDIDDLVRKGS